MHAIEANAQGVAGILRAEGSFEERAAELGRAWGDDAKRLRQRLGEDGARAAIALGAELDRAVRTVAGAARVGGELRGDAAVVVLAWAESAAGGAELQIAPLLAAVKAHGQGGGMVQGATLLAAANANGQAAGAIERAARARLLRGPVRDALECLPFSGDGRWLRDPSAAAHHGRLDLLLWEAGSAALAVPGLGAFLWGGAAFDDLLLARARGPLRDRSLAARALATAADDLPLERAGAASLAQIDRLVRALASHPEPSVWTHAARAMGRLSARLPEVRMRLFEQLDSANAGERRRAVTALAAAPAIVAAWPSGSLEKRLENTTDPWTLAAVGPAIPHLSRERRAAWERFVHRIEEGPAGPEVLSSVTSGLLALARREEVDRASQQLLRFARDRALAAEPRSETEAQLWRAIRRDTDFLDGLEPDPADLDLCLERVAAAAVRHGAARVHDRAAFLARSLRATFEGARRSAIDASARDERGAALAVMESCSRAAALGLWVPILRAAGRDPAPASASAGDARRAMLAAMTEDLARPKPDFELHRVALRVLGHVADATPAPRVEEASPPRGRVADATPPRLDETSSQRGRVAAQVLAAMDAAPWLSQLKKRDASRFEKPAADVLWRVLDATRGAAVPPADPLLFARFAAWWAFASAGTDLFDLLGRTEAAAREDRAAAIRGALVTLRAALDPDIPRALTGAWAGPVDKLFGDLGAADTALGRGLTLLAAALETMAQGHAWLTRESLIASLTLLAEARGTLVPLLRNPELALSSPRPAGSRQDSRDSVPNTVPAGRDAAPSTVPVTSNQVPSTVPAGRDAAPSSGMSPGADREAQALVEQSVAVRDAADPEAVAARWREGMGPVLGPLVEKAVSDLCQVHAGRDARPPQSGPPRIGRYLLQKQLGAGAMGVVWLARDPATERYLVVKVPAGNFVDQPMDVRADFETSLSMEANILRAIYHPNVATFVDHGWHESRPYLVLEYLIGVDLADYAWVRPLTLEECKPVVQDLCAGLRALHCRGLVHCDMKPGNVFLRLDMPPLSMFEPERHRSPEVAPLLSAIVIDFGLVRMFGRSNAPGGVRGTPGFIAPEQAQGSLVIDPKADVYGLAATVYAAMSGRRFFEGIDAVTECLKLHATEPPLRDRATTKMLPRKVANLLRDATELDPARRPDLVEIAKRFAEL